MEKKRLTASGGSSISGEGQSSLLLRGDLTPEGLREGDEFFASDLRGLPGLMVRMGGVENEGLFRCIFADEDEVSDE